MIALKDRVNAIALALIEDLRRDSDLFGEAVPAPEAQRLTAEAMKQAFRRTTRNWPWAHCWPT